jgi:hypothetical protein
MRLTSAPLRKAIPFTQAAMLARAADVRPVAMGRPGMVFGIPGQPRGLKLGNMPAGLSDYINSPGTPGSSTFYLYGLTGLGGLGQEDDMYAPTDYASSSASDDVSPSTSPSFMQSITSLFGQTVDAAKTIVPAVLQQQRVAAASKQLAAGQITPYQYQQITGQPTATFALTPSAGLATGLKIGGGTIALLGAAALAFLFLRKR